MGAWLGKVGGGGGKYLGSDLTHELKTGKQLEKKQAVSCPFNTNFAPPSPPGKNTIFPESCSGC